MTGYVEEHCYVWEIVIQVRRVSKINSWFLLIDGSIWQSPYLRLLLDHKVFLATLWNLTSSQKQYVPHQVSSFWLFLLAFILSPNLIPIASSVGYIKVKRGFPFKLIQLVQTHENWKYQNQFGIRFSVWFVNNTQTCISIPLHADHNPCESTDVPVPVLEQ